MDDDLEGKPTGNESALGAGGETLANGRYVIFGQLGQGSQAETVKAVDKLAGQKVAIKRFRIGHAKTWKDVELAEREARTLATLSHPALPRYIEHFEEQGCLYLVMECVEGESLANYTRDGHRLDLNELRRLLGTLSDALDYLHSRIPPVIHRDIKPGNIIRRPDGSFCLVDFGSVRDGLRPEGGSTVVGTFGYMAPEQFQGRAQPSSDLYAVGALLLALLTQRPPETLPHRGLGIDTEAALGGNVPAPWVRLITQLVNIDPDQRPQRLAALLPALDAATYGAPQYQQTGSTANRSDGAARRSGEPNRQSAAFDAEVVEPDSSFTAMVGTGFGPVPFIILMLARIAVWAVLCVAVPVLLEVLSIFFGKGLRRAAKRVATAGQQVQQHLGNASQHLRNSEPFILRGKHYGPKRRRGRSWQDPRGYWQQPNSDWQRAMRVDLPEIINDAYGRRGTDAAPSRAAKRQRPAEMFDDLGDGVDDLTAKKRVD